MSKAIGVEKLLAKLQVFATTLKFAICFHDRVGHSGADFIVKKEGRISVTISGKSSCEKDQLELPLERTAFLVCKAAYPYAFQYLFVGANKSCYDYHASLNIWESHQFPSGLHEEGPPQHDSAGQQQQTIPGSPIDGLSQQLRKSLDLEEGDNGEEKEDEWKGEPLEPCRLR
uniref:Uncharacterized protein n=1 Tax=Chromera velia CCMP2878 TaxID=1169474 RepID=A0A0G4HWH8_9ALVE|eukprot:Cvel_9045.t1-p1 / transcript=Cvel_9045.t1 / gene=Cvel_9045 / organism=Chromera_velia_CCMP2878 / gene_product=hypothetical protein / transcript_product=hypothetical protein / location=Cvel_scaffold512:70088-83270(-) / protein_length=171 / sequence_SO=supercontig / SO=protein_coding / is_pseudo=false